MHPFTAHLGIVGWIFLGALAGWLANMVTPTRLQMGCLVRVAVGIMGAFIGGLLFSALGGAGVTGFNLWSLFVSFIGAVIFLLLLNALQER
ncbi:MAG TPA: GlsB/YeaQ/YmgE family stress response membrane protein [Armatimonadota bacterium]|jgi:uncharacterized membrane protein YeaQ/YmgE (transglycosylase-associated protein family)